ncbi:cyclic AMP-dependent transcription factor ATF-2 [Wyeomyia smithii]|uniref:cyclic AMP-dependent transcription factor ATF-2 n=1 Tax=Wyeomyia smithii TaxID=174621 RepID=UPI002467E026|nr:cyclic AMP-dependent transcription factor ATF-2 [Wyeomyia smithii]
MDAEKPFPCKIGGCKFSFATEDHLLVHRKKHDMLLNLDIPNKVNMFADQTPTPTRLIGKCEEVGLFDDLQNVNPFEETFRRAVEEKSAKTGDSFEEKQSSPVKSTVLKADDTLHTPHIFPLLERRESIKLSKLIISRNNSRKDETLVDDALKVQAQVHEHLISTKVQMSQNSSRITKAKSLIKILPKTTYLPTTEQSVIIIPCNMKNGESSSTRSNGINLAKAKLKEHLKKNNSPANCNNTSETNAFKVSSVDKEANFPEQSSNVTQDKTKNVQKHERWKAAAKRYRTKVKQNQNSLHRKNIELAEENHRLKTEIARLRNLLSLHKECSVTKSLTDFAAAGPSTIPRIAPAPARLPSQSITNVCLSKPNPTTAEKSVFIILRGDNLKESKNTVDTTTHN